MKQNEQHVYEGSRWVLYHGTSTGRLQRILEGGRLRAEYFACNAVFSDKHDHPGEKSSPVVLVLDGRIVGP